MFHFNSRLGFTLIELLIVMFIIGLTSSLVLPAMMKQIETTRELSELEKIKNIVSLTKVQSFYAAKQFKVDIDDNQLEISEYIGNEEYQQRRLFVLNHITFMSKDVFLVTNGVVEDVESMILITNRGREMTLSL
ncbi:hypothetical protein AX660_17345 [Paraglaciecola hydrolytica]|uniref:Uncharacterized protein n=2 Tax=Paraglaciecola hydrolytica TaxID=1799789 RepID=A0A135ZZ46_9ALTE|nr:hypothetical protein AX660_17345 [Paraglaciecola hydrolytica]